MTSTHPLEVLQLRVEGLLKRYLEDQRRKAESPFHFATSYWDALQHAVLLGGKRLRPLLIYATAEIFDLPLKQVDGLAMAVECIHAYSLTHDDLPALDNDAWRRGQPSCHKAYGEDMAILVGDALQNAAFAILSHASLNPVPLLIQAQQIQQLAEKTGLRGMVLGQVMDLAPIRPLKSELFLAKQHLLKTGALLEACFELVFLVAGQPVAQGRRWRPWFQQFGLFYQALDDLKDHQGSFETLGKPPQADLRQRKVTLANATPESPTALQKNLQATLTQLRAATPSLQYLSALLDLLGAQLNDLSQNNPSQNPQNVLNLKERGLKRRLGTPFIERTEKHST